MATQAVATQQGAALVEKVVIGGDLKDLSPVERVQYYRQVCDSLGLNYLTKPFDYITLNGKLTLYARKDCTDQLRKRDSVSVTGLDAQVISDVYVVKAMARIGDRTDMATGAVSIKGVSGENLANAMLKAETKAKRRVTLSICGLGMLDESEADSVPGAQRVDVDMQTGAITPPTPVYPQPTPTASTGHRPYAPAELTERFATIITSCKDDPMKEGIRGLTAGWLDLCFVCQDSVVQKRHSLVKYLTGKTSLNEATWQELRALKRWLNPVEDSGGAFKIDAMAEAEAQLVIKQVMLDSGQTELPIFDDEQADAEQAGAQ